MTVAQVVSASVPRTSEYIGTLKSRRSVIIQPQIEGLVTRIFVTSGAKVQAGDALLQIDPARQEALVTSEQATRAARQATMNYWKQQAERLALLHEGGAVSKQESDQARTSYESARADVNALDAQVRQQQVQLRYYRVTAPAAGTVGDIPVRVGDRVTPATRLTTLDQSGMLEAYLSVPVESASALREGLAVHILGEGGASLAKTQVSFVAPLVSDDTQSVLVKALIENQDGALRPGQFVRARLVWGDLVAPVVPVTAVFRLNGGHFVYTVADDKDHPGSPPRAHQRAVSLGELADNRYPVRAGLQAGERIVISGVQKLRDKSPLLVQAPAAPQAPAKPEGQKE